MRLKIVLVLAVALVFLVLILYFAKNSVERKENRVERVFQAVDGDTVELVNGQRVRLLGIDAPEKGQHYYFEAGERLGQLVEGKEVFLEKDVSDRDSYGRLLRYVYVGSLFVNLEMVEEGYTKTFIVAPNLKYSFVFLKVENETKTKGIGIWKSVKS
jgi:micrococcal nuclease